MTFGVTRTGDPVRGARLGRYVARLLREASPGRIECLPYQPGTGSADVVDPPQMSSR